MSNITTNKLLKSITIVSFLAVTYSNPVTANQRESGCAQHIQDKVAWDNKGHTQWDQVNIIKLCQGTTNPKEPGECFDKVMNGHIKWGEGDVWKWENAISLCAGTSDAEKTIDCFQKQIHASTAWDKAIQQCQFKDASTTNIK